MSNPNSALADDTCKAIENNSQVELKDYLDWSTAPLGQVVKGRLHGKVAIVTGASSGIGAVTARRLAAEGAKVVLFARRENNLALIVNAIKKAGGEAALFVGDAAKEEDNKNLVDFTVKTFGGLHIAFNNAGIVRAWGKKPWEVDTKDFVEVMGTNVNSIFFGVKYQSLAVGKSGGGVIVNNASVAAFYPSAGSSVYAASKTWVVGYTHHVAAELAQIGVRINSISPGPTLSDVFGCGEKSLQQVADFGKQLVPIARVLKPEEIAAAVAYFGSDEGKPITGIDFLVDGGASAAFKIPAVSS